MEDDRRDSRRVLYNEPVAYTQPEVTVNGGVAHNVSLTGLSLWVQEFIPVGVVLELQMRLGQFHRVIWVKAKIVRIREVLSADSYEIGLRFFKDEECIKAVGEYINSYRSNST
jgi:PilZ domain